MADVGKEPAFGRIQFDKLLVAFLQHLLVLVQLKSQGKLTKTEALVKQAANDDEGSRHHQEVKIIDEGSNVVQVNRVDDKVVQDAHRDVHADDFKEHDRAIAKTPSQQDGCSDQDQRQSCVVRRIATV